ncbi:glycoside hydrolase [Pterulicium gracile]|uniref:glucan endo-1,3-beta-D-glucosidase n=1 Tax=Pterulicium gracile TaxID=1884261 RepID=A0A5C3QVB5_9AGAR|nr:glycoside hydrolase [Pterula gracilis]
MTAKQGLENTKISSHTQKVQRTWLIFGITLLFTGLTAIGLAVAVLLSHNNSASTASTSVSRIKSGPPSKEADLIAPATIAAGTKNVSNDPSYFTRNSALRKSFYGLAYTPEGSMLPNCGNSLESVIRDVQIMSQLTDRIRLYGADCDQSALVLEAIKRTKVDLGVFLAIYPVDGDPTAYVRQRDLIKDAILTYGSDHILGVTVGNEYLLNYLRAHNGSDPDSALARPAVDVMKSNVKDTQDMLTALRLPKIMPVGTAEAGSFFNTEVLGMVDYGMSNVHAWFANKTVSYAAEWTINFYQKKNVKAANKLPNNPTMYLAEAGWPTRSSDLANADNGVSLASEANLQIFMDTFLCQAKKDEIPYFFFEFYDEKWKDATFGGVEGWWGLFNADRTLKNVTIPDCSL